MTHARDPRPFAYCEEFRVAAPFGEAGLELLCCSFWSCVFVQTGRKLAQRISGGTSGGITQMPRTLRAHLHVDAFSYWHLAAQLSATRPLHTTVCICH